MSKTVKQIADELGVSKQAVHQKRKSKELSTALQPFTSTVDGVVYISVDGENLIKQAFLKNDRKQVDDKLSSTVDGSFTPSFTPPEDSEVVFLRGQVEKLQAELEKEREHNREKERLVRVWFGKEGQEYGRQGRHLGCKCRYKDPHKRIDKKHTGESREIRICLRKETSQSVTRGRTISRMSA